MNSKEALIRQVFQNPATGLISAEKLYQKLKDRNVSRKEIHDFLQKQETYQLHKRPRRIRHYFPIVSNGVNDILQIDLADFSDIATTNAGYKYLVTIVDVFSRYAYVYPIKNKTAESIINTVTSFLDSVKGVRKLMSDNGSEFINREYKQVLAQHGVTPIYVDNGEHHNHKLAIVDRFIRTLRGMINRYQTMMNTTRYISVLPLIVQNYNNTYHSGIKCKPSEPNVESIKEDYISKTMEALLEEQTFDIGDRVRYLKNTVLFQKGSAPNWSKTIHAIVAKTLHSYKLDNGKTFKYYELSPVVDVQTVDKITTRAKAREPTREQQQKVNTGKRRLKREGLPTKDIVDTKRTRVPTNRYHV